MTNQKYIEEIIKVAVQGDYCEKDFSESPIEIDIQQSNKHEYHVALKFKDNITDGIYYDLRGLLLDPNFFRAIGKVKRNKLSGWEAVDNDTMIKHALHFYEINLTEDLDHAIEWLYNLIKE